MPALVACVTLVGVAALPAREEPERADVVRIVRESFEARRDAGFVDAATLDAELAASLRDLGPDAVPVLLRLADGSEPEILGEIVSGLHVPMGAVGSLGTVATDAIAGMRADDVIEPLRAAADGAPSARRIEVVRILGRLGTPQAVEPLLEVAEGFGPLPLTYRSVREPLAAALVATLSAGPCEGLAPQRLAWLDPELRLFFAESLGRVRRRHAVRLAAELLEEAREDDRAWEAALVDGLVASRAEIPWCFDELLDYELREHVERRLASHDPDVRRAAAVHAGQLRDPELAAVLVELLEDDDPSVALAAHHALRGASGLELARDAWPDWFEEQERWRAEHLDAELDRLGDDDPAVVARALRALAQRPLLGAAVELEIAAVLEHPRAEAVLAALRALELIGAARVAPFVVPLLEAEDEVVATAAAATLARLTARLATPDADAWREALEL